MSILPQLAQLELNQEEITQPVNRRVHAGFEWDFEQGEFVLESGRVISTTGLDYLKTWIQTALLTVKNTLILRQFNSEFGSEHHSLIGTVYKPSFTRAEYERYIREALLQNDAITAVGNFGFHQEGSRVRISFDVASIYGDLTDRVVV